MKLMLIHISYSEFINDKIVKTNDNLFFLKIMLRTRTGKFDHLYSILLKFESY